MDTTPEDRIRLMAMRQKAITRFCALVTADDPEPERQAAWGRVTGEVLLAEQVKQLATGGNVDEAAYAAMIANVDLAQVLAIAADPQSRQQLDPLRVLHERRRR